MATVRELVQGREVYTVQSNNSVQQAVSFMAERNVGAVPVLSNTDLVGVISERDVVRRVLMEGRDWKTTLVADVMTPEPLTVAPTEDAEHCMLLMKQHNFRHLPVCDGSHLVGFL